MQLKNLQIVIDRSQYYAGNRIHGVLKFNATPRGCQNFIGIQLTFHGKISLLKAKKFTELFPTQSITFNAEDINVKTSGSPTALTFDFQIPLDEKLPTSYPKHFSYEKSKLGIIRYWLKAQVIQGGYQAFGSRSNQFVEKDVVILQRIDIDDARFEKQVSAEISKTPTCTSRSGHLSATTDRGAYLPGDLVVVDGYFECQMKNSSKDVSVHLIRSIRTKNGKKTAENVNIQLVDQSSSEKTANFTPFKKRFIIPVDIYPPSIESESITVAYDLSIGIGNKLCLSLPLTVGTVTEGVHARHPAVTEPFMEADVEGKPPTPPPPLDILKEN